MLVPPPIMIEIIKNNKRMQNDMVYGGHCHGEAALAAEYHHRVENHRVSTFAKKQYPQHFYTIVVYAVVFVMLQTV